MTTYFPNRRGLVYDYSFIYLDSISFRSFQEASWEVGKVTPPKEWPTNGHIVFDDYQVRYREGLDLVLKGISCEVKGGEKVKSK